jgi:hypothetical protein
MLISSGAAQKEYADQRKIAQSNDFLLGGLLANFAVIVALDATTVARYRDVNLDYRQCQDRRIGGRRSWRRAR